MLDGNLQLSILKKNPSWIGQLHFFHKIIYSTHKCKKIKSKALQILFSTHDAFHQIYNKLYIKFQRFFTLEV
jgi:hypothetical protein